MKAFIRVLYHKKIFGFVIKILTTILLIYLLFKSIKFDYEDFKASFISIKPLWLILSFSGVIIVLGLKSYRWHLLLKQAGIFFSPYNSLRSYFSSYALGILTPGRLGEFIKIYNVRQSTGAKLMVSFRTTLVDRLFDLVMLLIFSISWIIIHLIRIEVDYLFAVLISIIILVSLIFILRKITQKIVSIKGKKFFKLFYFIDSCLLDMMGGKSFYPWLISLSAYFFFFLSTWFLFRSLNLTVSIIDSGFIICVIGLILLLPISIAGFGPRELSLVYILSLYGISAETALTFSVLQFTVFFAWGGLIGLLFWILNPIPMDAIKKDSKGVFSMLKETN